ncbi:MAG: MBL fold metallo-hydrolase [Treponema sp.]|nr:MBL fold metallo-hydrolase [Candidatus Treponema scatequi]
MHGQILGTHSFYLKNGFLEPDEYSELSAKYFVPGGETGTAATVLSSLGVNVKIDGKQIVHLGDTYYTEHLKKTLSRIGTIDVLITPINGMNLIKKLHGIIGNLSIKESVKLCTKLMPQNVIPSHFDMIKGNTAAPVKFINLMKIKNPEQKVFVPDLCKDILIK